jgi:general secretion pathway protein D
MKHVLWHTRCTALSLCLALGGSPVSILWTSVAAAQIPPIDMPGAQRGGRYPTGPDGMLRQVSVPAAGAASPGQVTVQPSQSAAPADPLRRNKTAKFTFEFSKAEVLDVVKAISDMTGQNFIIPEKIKGQRITIISPTRITGAEAYRVFYTALAANGISLVRSGKFLKLSDAKESIKDTVPTCIDNDPGCMLQHEQMVTLLLHLHYSDVGQINAVARSLLGRDGDIAVFAPSNALIISEYSPNLRRIRRIIEALDVPGTGDSLQMLQLHYSTAADMVEKVTQIYEVQAKGAAPQNRPPGRPGMPMPGMPHQVLPTGNGQTDEGEVRISKIIADDRTNQLIIKASPPSFEAVKNLVAKLDVPISDTEQGRVHVYYLENAKAEDLASTLSALASGAPTSSKAKAGGAPAPGSGAAAQSTSRPADGGSTSGLFEGEVKVTADKATNSLLIMSSGHDYRAVRGLIERLDRPRRQVYVEAAIMEVDLEDDESVGLNWHMPLNLPGNKLFGQPLEPQGSFLQLAESAKSPSPTITALTSAQTLLSATGGALGGVFGNVVNFNLGDGTPFRLPTFGIILKWLETSSNVNILSTPHLLTTDNEQAHIEVGQKVPFNTGLFGGLSGGLASAGGAAGGALSGLGGVGALSALGGGSVQRIDVSLKLTLTPQINEHNKIRLEVEQSVEDLTGESLSNATPTTSHRSLKTVIVAEDQQTVVLGGLMRDRNSDSETKLPFFGDLPLLGYLFKKRNEKVQKVNLLLVLTPYIINSQGDFQRIFERKLQEHEEFSAQYYGHRKEYRAHIDYSKKGGPLSWMIKTLRRERGKYENGGTGDGTEVMVGPGAPAAHPHAGRKTSLKVADSEAPEPGDLPPASPPPKRRPEEIPSGDDGGPGPAGQDEDPIPGADSDADSGSDADAEADADAGPPDAAPRTAPPRAGAVH